MLIMQRRIWICRILVLILIQSAQIIAMVPILPPEDLPLGGKTRPFLRTALAHFPQISKQYILINSKLEPINFTIKVMKINLDPIRDLCGLIARSLFNSSQINQCNFVLGHDVAARGRLPRPKDFSRALYVLDIGQNDLILGFRKLSDAQLKASLPDIVNQFANAVIVS